VADDTVYRVITVYDADTRAHESGVSRLISTFDHLMNVIDRVKDSIKGVLELNAAAETARISIAGLMQAGGAPGAADNFQLSMAMSAEIIK